MNFLLKLAAFLGWRRAPAIEYDLAYGPDPLHRLDVYHPEQPNGIVIFIVHGGGWRLGDKNNENVVDNKRLRWVPQGFTFVSVNYRLDNVNPIDQLNDVAAAFSFCQEKAKAWRCDPARFILMGHSAGGHLVSLLAVVAASYGTRAGMGTIALDSAAYDVVAIMEAPHLPLYDAAFGADPAFWRDASPIERLQRPPAPMLLVAGVTGGEDTDRFENVQAFADKVKRLGGRAGILPVDLSHADINGQLGLPGAYTDQVEAFMRSLT